VFLCKRLKVTVEPKAVLSVCFLGPSLLSYPTLQPSDPYTHSDVSISPPAVEHLTHSVGAMSKSVCMEENDAKKLSIKFLQNLTTFF